MHYLFGVDSDRPHYMYSSWATIFDEAAEATFHPMHLRNWLTKDKNEAGAFFASRRHRHRCSSSFSMVSRFFCLARTDDESCGPGGSSEVVGLLPETCKN